MPLINRHSSDAFFIETSGKSWIICTAQIFLHSRRVIIYKNKDSRLHYPLPPYVKCKSVKLDKNNCWLFSIYNLIMCFNTSILLSGGYRLWQKMDLNIFTKFEAKSSILANFSLHFHRKFTFAYQNHRIIGIWTCSKSGTIIIWLTAYKFRVKMTFLS